MLTICFLMSALAVAIGIILMVVDIVWMPADNDHLMKAWATLVIAGLLGIIIFSVIAASSEEAKSHNECNAIGGVYKVVGTQQQWISTDNKGGGYIADIDVYGCVK